MLTGGTEVKRRDFLKTAGWYAAGPVLGWAAARRPNVLVIIADDLGYADLGVQGCKDVPTPHIDSIGATGVRFTNGYVSCPVCSPTRAGLMTGRYQQRFGHEFNPGPAALAEEHFGLPLTEATLADRLKKLGYATGMVGKWHLGYKPAMHPQKRGFDEFFGFLGGAHSYVDAMRDKANPILRGTEQVNEKSYLTDALGREAAAFVERHVKEPFFLYLSFNAVHTPMDASERLLGRFGSITDARRRTFATMLASMDEGVGQVLGKLREHKLEENTLIFFVSDNGGPTPSNTSRNDPLRGYKGQVLEGGIRVPFLMQWKGQLPAGKVYEHPVIALDILPTAVVAAGGTIPSNPVMDGVNLVPYVTGREKRTPHERLYWRFGPQQAIRKGDWKLARLAEGAPQLYNLAEDVGEKNDLAGKMPEKVKELLADYGAWNQQLMEPQWKGRQAVLRQERQRQKKR